MTSWAKVALDLVFTKQKTFVVCRTQNGFSISVGQQALLEQRRCCLCVVVDDNQLWDSAEIFAFVPSNDRRGDAVRMGASNVAVDVRVGVVVVTKQDKPLPRSGSENRFNIGHFFRVTQPWLATHARVDSSTRQAFSR